MHETGVFESLKNNDHLSSEELAKRNSQYDEASIVIKMDQDLEHFFSEHSKDTKCIGRPRVNIIPPSELEMKDEKLRKRYKCFQISIKLRYC